MIHADGEDQFQSTPPARGATRPKAAEGACIHISIHAPREGGDYTISNEQTKALQFQSTPPARGATWQTQESRPQKSISIHAPREGGDGSSGSGKSFATKNFNPRPPRGGRPAAIGIDFNAIKFQSTPPARGATCHFFKKTLLRKLFQSTPPARGATAKMHSFICESLTNK